MPDDSPAAPEVDDRSIRDLVLSDPEKGWTLFLKHYQGSIKGLIWTFGLSHEDAEEVFQETCLRLSKNDSKLIRAWDPKRCSLRGYTTVVASSVCLNFLKSRFHSYSKRKASSDCEEFDNGDIVALLEDSAPSPFERLLRLEAAGRAQSTLNEWYACAGLTERDRALVNLRLRGLEYREIAAILGISESNAAVRYHRLKKEIEKLFIPLNRT